MKSIVTAAVVWVVLSFGGVTLGAGCAAVVNTDVDAGIAVVDVTPPVGYRMCGYFHERFGTGTHDPLYAKAVVLRQGDRQAALVFCDLAGIAPQVTAQARHSAEQKTGIPGPHILIAATHSHTGPLYYGALRNTFHDRAVAKTGSDPHEKFDYSDELAKKIVEAIVAAQKKLKPAKLQIGVAQQHGLSFNRRFHMQDGSVRTNPGQLTQIVRVAGPIDPDVGILMVRDAVDDRALASLTVFALHLDTVGGTLYSADYPFYLEQSLRQELGGEFVSMFGNGACGDINHIDVSAKDRLKTKYIGETLAATVKAELPKLKPLEGPSLAARSEIVHAPMLKYSPEEIAAAKRVMAMLAEGKPGQGPMDHVKAYSIMAAEWRGGDTLPIEVQVIRLGQDVAIVALPGEVFVDLALAIKNASPFAVTQVIELANDSIGYVPTRRACAEGGYETVNCRLEPGGGEMAVRAAVRLLEQLKQEGS